LTTRGVFRSRAGFAALIFTSMLLLASGCGGGKERANNPRPPETINVAVQIGEDDVDVSPAKFGAGPILLQASNQSNASHRLTLEGPQVKQTLGPINPHDTATLKVSVRPGEYTLSSDVSAGAQAKLTVGPERPSAQNKLLQP
jgi:hypothetical protein